MTKRKLLAWAFLLGSILMALTGFVLIGYASDQGEPNNLADYVIAACWVLCIPCMAIAVVLRG